MATIDFEALNAAHADGLFKRRLTTNQRRYLRQAILTACEIIQKINDRGDDGIGVTELAHGLGMNGNTIKIYCRWLVEKGLIEAETLNQLGTPLVYLSKKSYLARARSKS